MRVVINETNKERIKGILEFEQHRCRARVIEYENILNKIKRCEKKLHDLQIPKKYWNGITIFYDGSETFPAAYNGTPEATHYELLYSSGSWKLTYVCRSYCMNREKDTYITLTDQAKEKMVENLTHF